MKPKRSQKKRKIIVKNREEKTKTKTIGSSVENGDPNYIMIVEICVKCFIKQNLGQNKLYPTLFFFQRNTSLFNFNLNIMFLMFKKYPRINFQPESKCFITQAKLEYVCSFFHTLWEKRLCFISVLNNKQDESHDWDNNKQFINILMSIIRNSADISQIGDYLIPILDLWI